MSKEDRFALLFGGVEFTFRTEEQVLAFIEGMFTHSTNRRSLYHTLVQHSLEFVLSTAINGEAKEPQLNVLRAIKRVREKYGQVYDPNKEAFELLDDKHSMLD